MNIVSLLPSATEIICEIGLGPELVGVSHECDYPDFVARLPSLTRSQLAATASSREIDTQVRERTSESQALYALKSDILESLQPDLIVTQTLCSVCAVAESDVLTAIQSLPNRPELVFLEPKNLEEVLESLIQVGVSYDAVASRLASREFNHRETGGMVGITGRQRATQAVDKLRGRIDAVRMVSEARRSRPTVVVLEWLDPLFCVGHWTPQLIHLAGGRELIGEEGQPSRVITWDELILADPDHLVVACCGFDIARTQQELHILTEDPRFSGLKAAKNGKIHVMDGNASFSRPGPRLVDSLEFLCQLLA